MASETSILGNICAVVVTYNIGNAYESCFRSLKGQVDRVIAVNTSTDDGVTAKFLKKLAIENPDFLDVVESPENNLGMAQNLGIEKALHNGFDRILLLDHDSRLNAGMIAAMELAIRPRKDKDNIAIIAPALIDSDVDAKPRYLKLWNTFWFEQVVFSLGHSVLDDIICVSASGCLISSKILRETGIRMDEEMVIDGIDTDFSFQLIRKKHQIIAVESARMEHKLGNRKQHSFLGLKLYCTHHAPIRRYYLNRNRIAIWKRHGLAVPGFIIFDMMRTIYELWRILLLEDDKNNKLRHVMRGLWHGLIGLDGPRPGDDLTRTAEDKDHKEV